MSETVFTAEHNGIRAAFAVGDDGGLRLYQIGTAEFQEIADRYAAFELASFRAAEVQIAGRHHDEGHGTKNMGTSEGKTLRYVSHACKPCEGGTKLEIVQENDAIRSQLTYRFYDACRCVTASQSVENLTDHTLALEYVSSFMLYGLERNDPLGSYDAVELHVPVNGNYRENQWKCHALSQLGFVSSSKYSTTAQKVCFFNTGSWSAKDTPPCAYLRDRATGEHMMWSIESDGSYAWEIGDYNGNLYLGVSGPCLTENQWTKHLAPQETFVSTPVTLAFGADEEAMFWEMTAYRRMTRRVHHDNETLHTVYNPYMHDAGENPTEEGMHRVIEGVRGLDLDYFCLDAGWHDDGDNYWKAIGDWTESHDRFPSGLRKTLDLIREAGMKPGLWIEIQHIGYYNAHRDELPVGCCFMRHGGVIANMGRIQLDFSRAEVTARVDEIMDRIMRDYDPGYIKFDYNADCGAGSDINAESLGEGLRRHKEAYVAWVERLMDRYPEVVFENCASGGLSIDPVTMRLFPIHSTSDQTDYMRYPFIASNMLTHGTPEQCAVWCYPLEGQSDEAIIMNMVNTMLGRIHLSGKTYLMDTPQRALIEEGLRCHRAIAACKRRAMPVWPMGLNTFDADTAVAGLLDGDRLLLAVWNLKSARTVTVPIRYGEILEVKPCYPLDMRSTKVSVDCSDNSVSLDMQAAQARFVELKLKS